MVPTTVGTSLSCTFTHSIYTTIRFLLSILPLGIHYSHLTQGWIAKILTSLFSKLPPLQIVYVDTL